MSGVKKSVAPGDVHLKLNDVEAGDIVGAAVDICAFYQLVSHDRINELRDSLAQGCYASVAAECADLLAARRESQESLAKRSPDPYRMNLRRSRWKR